MNETKMANDGTQPKAGMNEGPKLYMKCLHTKDLWWTPGRLYPIEDDGLVMDSDVAEVSRLKWSVTGLLRGVGGEWRRVWVWPDGTEVDELP